MHFIEAAIFILAFAILSVPVAIRSRLPLEIFLVIGSCVISLALQLPNFEINPIIVFNLFLPLILFYAAYFTSWREFKSHKRAIGLLSVGLVLFTTAIIACVTKWILPVLPWAECFLLGAIISPTDASSATAIIKKLGAPKYLIMLLEAESLINDATALILFRFSLAAVILGTFSFSHAIAQFFIISSGGIVLGLVTGVLGVYLIPRIHSAPATTTLTFIAAIATYLAGEYLHVSGVIATVVCGIYFGIKLPEVSSAQGRIQAKVSWDTLMFIINGFAFTLIGLELPTVIRNLQPYTVNQLFFYGAIVSLTVIGVRVVWVFTTAYLSRWLFPSVAKNDPLPPNSYLFLLGWSGMRGIVSLAAALSLPIFMAPSVLFPNRDLILFITYFVIVVTLIVPAFSLPILIKRFGLTNIDNLFKKEVTARVKALEEVSVMLCDIAKKEGIPDNMVEEFKNKMERNLNVIRTQLNDQPYSTLNDEYHSMKRLALAVVEREKKTLLALRKTGEIDEEIFQTLLEELDREDLRAKTLRL